MSTVACSACGAPSPAGKKFCEECGSPLSRICPSCGAAVGPTAKFCSECATVLPAADAPRPGASTPIPSSAARSPRITSGSATSPVEAAPVPSEERRLVTALFCDLVGFTPLSERLDPEEVREVQAAYFSAMNIHVTRYGGMVEKYAGDAILAVFGMPAAHEDDAERAVLCALAMQQAIGPVAEDVLRRHAVEVAIRVGVNTGEVVSGSWEASGGSEQAGVSGDAVNTAARIEAAADPGGVLVGAETMRLTRRRILYGEERLLALKGKGEPVRGYPALGVTEQVGERWETIRQVTPLVARERELAQLFDVWQRVTSGEGQLLTVIGEPGVGKSRLLSEAMAQIKEQSADARLLRGRCLSYGQSISLWLIADLLRGLVGVQEGDGPDRVREAVSATLMELLSRGDAEDQRETIDVLGEVLGLPVGGSMVAQAGPQVRRAALVRSLRRVLGALTERSSVILVLEDLHWIDEASQEVIGEVLVDVPGLRLMVLAAQRQGWRAPWGEWSWTERISLRPLGESDTALLAGAILGGQIEGDKATASLAPDLLTYLRDRAGGNPFFVEELIRALQEAEGLELEKGIITLKKGAAEKLPATLTEVILARLDRLEAQVKSVAQVGSVIGRSFAVRLLAQVMEQSQAALELPLTALQQAELAFPRRMAELEYVFKHVTVQEVAYGMLVQKRRKQLHLQTARAIAALYPSDDYVEMIAYHFERSGEDAEAIPWLERAGDRAASIYANETAVAHYQEARKRLEKAGGQLAHLARLDEKLGGVLFTAGKYDEAIPILERTIETYRQERDLEGAGRATARLGLAHRLRGTPQEGIAMVEPMIDLLGARGPSSALGSLHIALSHLYFLVGRYREMMGRAEQGGEIARAMGDERLLGEAEERRGVALGMLGEWEEACRVLERALPLVEAGGDLETLSFTLTNLGDACGSLGRMEQAQQCWQQAVAVTERMGNPSRLCYSLCEVAIGLIVVGEWKEARRALQRAELLVGMTGRGWHLAVLTASLGELALHEGDWEEASRSLEEALALAEGMESRQMREHAQFWLAELDVLKGRPEAAIKRLEPLVKVDKRDDMLAYLAWAYLCIDDETHIEMAAAVAERAVSQGRKTPGVLAEALWVKGMVLIRQGRNDEAQGVLTEGLALARSMPHPYLGARILVQLGVLQKQRGEPEQARERLEESLTIFRRLGARKDVEQVETLLRSAT
jgi:adenylate cyclase